MYLFTLGRKQTKSRFWRNRWHNFNSEF